MTDAAAAPAPTAAPSGASPAPSPAPTGAGSSAPTQQPANAPGRETPSPSATAPKRDPILIKHKARIAGADGTEAEHELDVDIAEHVHSMKHRIKSDGADRELTLAELLERAPLADGAFRRMREAADTKKKADALTKQVEAIGKRLSDPQAARDVLVKTLGGPEKARAFVERWMHDIIADEKMTPEQREARQRETEGERRIRTEREKLDRDRAAFDKERNERTQAEAKAHRERYAKEWPGHLERAGIKSTERAMRMMAGVHREALDAGFTLTDEQAAREVAKEYAEHLGEQGKALPSKQAADLAAIEAQPGRSALPRTPGGQFAPSSDKRPPPATLEEYRQRQREASEEAYQASLRRR